MIVVPGTTGKKGDVSPFVPVHSVVPEMTLENVYREILLRDIKHPDVVLRQVICETMWLKCDNCSMKFNNLFGFTTRNGFMKFKTWVDCIKFYKQWQDKLHLTGYEDYYNVLKRARFAVYEDYTRHLKSFSIAEITSQFEKPRGSLANPADVFLQIPE